MRWGDLSYPNFLVHTLVLILFGQWLLSGALSLEPLYMLGRGYASLVAFSAATALATVLVHRFVEIPMAWAMRTSLQGWKTNSA